MAWNITQAKTNTVYITVFDQNGGRKKIRLADHMDVYANADFFCDPDRDDYKKIISWIKANGEKPAPEKRIFYAAAKDCAIISHPATMQDAALEAAALNGIALTKGKFGPWKKI